MSGFTEQKIIAVEYLKDAMIFFSKAGIVLPKDAVINIYHHNGAGHIRETGAVFINIVNRDYCKSYIVMLQGQNYPCHYHKIKTESFYLLFGSLGVYIEEQEYLLEPGEMLHIERGQEKYLQCTCPMILYILSRTSGKQDMHKEKHRSEWMSGRRSAGNGKGKGISCAR